MTALADRPSASGLTLQPQPGPDRSTIAIAPFASGAASERLDRYLTIDLAGVERWQQPAFVSYLETVLNDLLRLDDGWDGRRARAIRREAVESTVRVLSSLMTETSAPPQLFPLPDGGIQAEWHVGGSSIEAEIDGNGEAHVLALTADGATIAEGEVPIGEPDPQLLLARHFLQLLSARLPQTRVGV